MRRLAPAALVVLLALLAVASAAAADSGSISGSVRDDPNGNGATDSGELGLGGATVGFDTNGDQALDVTTTTADDGSYSFTGLAAGTYQVSELLPPGFFQGANAVGTVNGTPDGALVGTSAIGSISLLSGDAGTEYDFAVLPPPS
jgi:hypothetical protein